MAAQQIIDLERERDSILFYEKRIIEERDEILKNLRKHVNALDAEIIRLGGRPRPELRHADGRRISSGSLRQQITRTDGGGVVMENKIAVAEKRRQSQAPKKVKRRKSFQECTNAIVRNAAENSNLQPVKKPRGRPRKYPISVTGTTVGMKKQIRHVLIPGAVFEKPKKKKGRPPKNQVIREAEAANSKIQNSTNAASKRNDQKLISSCSPSDSDSARGGCRKKSFSCVSRARNISQTALKHSGDTPTISNTSNQNTENDTLRTLSKLAIDGANASSSKVVDSNKTEQLASAVAANEAIGSDGLVGKSNWNCNCGEILPFSKPRCEKCHRWRDGQRLRQRRSKRDKENSKPKQETKAKLTSNASVHEIYAALSNKCVTDNEIGSPKFVMETMVKALSYKGLKEENKSKKRKSGKKAEQASDDKPKRKRGRPRKYPVMLIVRSRPDDDENNGVDPAASASKAVIAKPSNVTSASIPEKCVSSVSAKDAKTVAEIPACLSNFEAKIIESDLVKGCPAQRDSSLSNATSAHFPAKKENSHCASNSEVLEQSQAAVERSEMKVNDTKALDTSSANTTVSSLETKETEDIHS